MYLEMFLRIAKVKSVFSVEKGKKPRIIPLKVNLESHFGENLQTFFLSFYTVVVFW